MGNSPSQPGVSLPERSSPSVNYFSRCRQYLDTKLTETIKEKWAEQGKEKIRLNRLLLKLPRLYEGLGHAVRVFHELDGTGEIGLEQLRTGAARLGYEVDPQLLESAFVSTDVDRSSTINVDEFIVVLAILHLLQGPSPDGDRTTTEAFDFITRAFLSFDSSREGFVSRDELMEALLEPHLDSIPASPRASPADSTFQPVAQQRFLELDQDGNGRISFPDFLACITHWVDEAGEEFSPQ